MIKQDELANPESCLNRAASDEPIFVLRANDPCAPMAVRNWAAFYRNEKERENNRGPMTEKQRAKYNEARALADRMEQWQADHGIRPWA